MNQPGILAGLLSCHGIRACRDRLVAFGILPPEPLYASRRIHQPLLACKERVAHRANFHVNVALVGRPCFKIVSAGTKHAHCSVIGMNFFLRHLGRQTFPAIFSIIIVGGFARFRKCRGRELEKVAPSDLPIASDFRFRHLHTRLDRRSSWGMYEWMPPVSILRPGKPKCPNVDPRVVALGVEPSRTRGAPS